MMERWPRQVHIGLRKDTHMTPQKTLITGASSGIGAIYADRLAARHHDLVLVARSEPRLRDLANRLEAAHGVVVDIIVADLGNRADLARVEERLRADGDIGMLINNAGVANSGKLAAADADRLEAMIRLNVVALTRLAAAAAPRFAAVGAGTIVNIGSVTALMPEAFDAVYSATKAFVLAFTQSLHAELASRGVTVQAVLPGATRTAIWEGAGVDIDTLPAAMLMEVEAMVDAAIAGLDSGEAVTIPSLPDMADWEAYERARLALQPNLSRNLPAARYLATATAA